MSSHVIFGMLLRRSQVFFRIRHHRKGRGFALDPDPFSWTLRPAISRVGFTRPMANSGRNSGRTSLAATRALTDWATSGAAWLLVLSTTAVTTTTAVVMAAGIGGAVVILTVLQRGYSCKAGVGRVFEHRIVMRATLLSGAAVILLDQTVDRGLGSAVLATALATGAVQAGRFVVDRMEDRLRDPRVVRRPGDRAGRRERRDRCPRPDRRARRGGLDDPRLRRSMRPGGRAAGVSPTSVRATIWCRRCRPPARRSSSRRRTRSGASPPTPNSSRSGERAPTCACTPGCGASTIVRSAPAPIGHDTLLCLDVPRLLGFQRLLKRLLDVTLAALVLVVTAPILMIGAVAIKVEDRGPVIFRQRRVGRNGTTFAMPKLRSMSVDAERRIGDITHLNERGGGPLFKVAHDPRVTKVGRLLRGDEHRRTSPARLGYPRRDEPDRPAPGTAERGGPVRCTARVPP